MGKIQLITSEQKTILDEINQNSFVSSTFYFTGGTALSAVYLHHRYSDDLDFFSAKKLDKDLIFAYVEELSHKYNFTFQSRFVEVVYIFNLTFQNGKRLKVDFATYPYPPVGKSEKIKNIAVDSLLDIAVNKLLTISQRSEVKDFVDLYFLLQKFGVWDLREGVRVKFNIEVEPLLLAADCLKVEDFTFLPQMILPLSLDELKHFFRELAKKLGKQSLA